MPKLFLGLIDFKTLNKSRPSRTDFNIKMKLVEAVHKDADLGMQMIRDFYKIDNYPFSKPKALKCFEQLIENDELGRFWLIYNDENQPIGYMIICFGFSFEYGGRDAFIDEFYFIPEARGKGFGTKALLLLREKSKKLNIKAIHLEVEKANSAGNKLYTKVGFKGNNRSLLTQIID